MNIRITVDRDYCGNDPTADLARYAATLADNYVASDLEVSTITVTVQVPDYGPEYPATTVGTVTVDWRDEVAP